MSKHLGIEPWTRSQMSDAYQLHHASNLCRPLRRCTVYLDGCTLRHIIIRLYTHYWSKLLNCLTTSNQFVWLITILLYTISFVFQLIMSKYFMYNLLYVSSILVYLLNKEKTWTFYNGVKVNCTTVIQLCNIVFQFI